MALVWFKVTALLCCVAGFQEEKLEFGVFGFGMLLRAEVVGLNSELHGAERDKRWEGVLSAKSAVSNRLSPPETAP